MIYIVGIFVACGEILGQPVSVVGEIVGIFVACSDGEKYRKFAGDTVGYFAGEVVTIVGERVGIFVAPVVFAGGLIVTIVGDMDGLNDGDIVTIMLRFNDGVFVCWI